MFEYPYILLVLVLYIAIAVKIKVPRTPEWMRGKACGIGGAERRGGISVVNRCTAVLPSGGVFPIRSSSWWWCAYFHNWNYKYIAKITVKASVQLEHQRTHIDSSTMKLLVSAFWNVRMGKNHVPSVRRSALGQSIPSNCWDWINTIWVFDVKKSMNISLVDNWKFKV